MDKSPPPLRTPVKLLHTLAVRVLSTLAIRDPSLTKAASQLKLWGIGHFEDSQLGIDQVLANEEVTYLPMRDCVMQFLVTILAYGEQLCNRLSDGDDSIRALTEEITVVFAIEALGDMVVEGRQDAADGPSYTSDVASSVQRLFTLSPSIRRARQLQSLQMQKIASKSEEGNQISAGYTTKFTSIETFVGILYSRLEAVAEIVREYDKTAASNDTDTNSYSPAFDEQRKRLGRFYEVRCNCSSLRSIQESVRNVRLEEDRLTNALADFISHSIAGPQPDKISAIINLVGDTATKLFHEDAVEQPQLRHGGSGNTITSQATGKLRLLQEQRERSSHEVMQ